MIVKMCGLRSREAAEAAAYAGADFLGFVFWPRSRRYVEPQAAREIGQGLGAKRVGVFVDEVPERVNEIAEMAGLDYIQLHGHEGAAYAERLCRPVIKAYRYGEDFTAEAANAFPAEIILLDSGAGGLPGGTGQAFAWREAAAEARRVEKPLLVAGGINPANVAEALDIFRPYGVDVSGSLEEQGEKSPRLMREFMAAVGRWKA